MLLELHVRDFAIVDRVDIDFGPGLCAITGETGAGKSLVVAALDLVRGGKPRGGSAVWVRSGAERAVVAARFALPPIGSARASAVDAWFARHTGTSGPARSADGSGELVLERVLDTKGRSRARAGEHVVGAAALAEIAGLFIEVNGQFEQRGLEDGSCALGWFDEVVAEPQLERAKADFAEARAAWRAASDAATRQRARLLERDGREAFLELALAELERLAPQAGEALALREERDVLRHAQRIAAELGPAADLLSEGDEPIVQAVSALVERLAGWARVLPRLESVASALEGALAHLEEGAAELVAFTRGVEADPARLEWLEERLAELERAARRHGGDVEQLADVHARLRAERDELLDLDADVQRANAAEAAARAALEAAALALDERRRTAAPQFEARVAPYLARLALGDARLSAWFEEPSDGASAVYGPDGRSTLELVWQPCAGEPPRPLVAIASGGEASRVFLAVRCAAAQRVHRDERERGGGSDARTLLFDEVDAAVGGRLAARIAECLAELGASGQVVAVTHQAAVAARADTHVAVSKSIVGGRAVSRAQPLRGEERVMELAAMIAGADATENATREARRMLAMARIAREGRASPALDATPTADGGALSTQAAPPTEASTHGDSEVLARPRSAAPPRSRTASASVSVSVSADEPESGAAPRTTERAAPRPAKKPSATEPHERGRATSRRAGRASA
jgi:DNA repair protein RecN (Recombination protein N)